MKFIALDLTIYFNSSKSSETSVTVTSFIWKRENFPDFLCMNAMHTLVFSHFVASKPGILQPLPLKLNFAPKFERSHVSECGIDLNRSQSFKLHGDPIRYNWIYPLSRSFLESSDVWHWYFLQFYDFFQHSKLIVLLFKDPWIGTHYFANGLYYWLWW